MGFFKFLLSNCGVTIDVRLSSPITHWSPTYNIYTLYDKQIIQDQSLSIFNFKIADLISSIWILIKNYRKTICWKKPKKSSLSYRVFPLYNEIDVFSKHCDRPEMVRWHWFSFLGFYLHALKTFVKY